MATFVIGDIHGHLAPLADVLRHVAAEAVEGDAVVFLGDYIDRGPDSRGCVEAILEFRSRTRAAVVCLMGNHEDWMLRTRHDYTRHSWLLAMEVLPTVRSYSAEAEQELRDAIRRAGLSLYVDRVALDYGVFFDRMPVAHHEFFDTLAPYFDGPDCFCSHAGLDPTRDGLLDQTVEAFVWGARGFPENYRLPRPVVYGHWNNAALDADGWPHPRILGATIGIDTIAHGVLTAACMPDNRFFQSARYGDAIRTVQ